MKTEKKVTKFQAFFIHYRNIAEFGLATSCLMSFTFKALSELVLFIKGYKVSYPSFLIILVFLSCLVISFSDLIMISLSKKYSKILKGMVEFESKPHKKLVNEGKNHKNADLNESSIHFNLKKEEKKIKEIKIEKKVINVEKTLAHLSYNKALFFFTLSDLNLNSFTKLKTKKNKF